MLEQPKKIAVLTGDLVNSTALGTEKITAAFGVLEKCAQLQRSWMGAHLHFTRHRGDGWQVVLEQPKMALRSALAFRAALRAEDKAFDSYIGIAEGEITTEISEDLNHETAEVFVRSGEVLEDLKATKTPVRMLHDSLGAMDAAIILGDQIFQHWTQAQAKAMVLALGPDDPITFTEIAERLGKSRQAVTKTLKAAGIEHLTLALETFDRKART